MQFSICKIKHLVLDEMLSIPVTFVYEYSKGNEIQKHSIIMKCF